MNVAAIVIGSIVGGLVFVGAIILAVRKYEQARTAKLQSLADEMGLQFHPKSDPATMDSIGHLRLFNQGHGRSSRNMICGRTEDIELAVFGYFYTTGGGQSQQTHQQTVMSFRSGGLSLPKFELRPEGLLHRIGQALGYQDIDFDSHPRFSAQFLLRGPDEEAIREFFAPELLEFFESMPGISVEASGDRVIYYRAGKRIKPEEVRSFMEEGFKVFAQLRET